MEGSWYRSLQGVKSPAQLAVSGWSGTRFLLERYAAVSSGRYCVVGNVCQEHASTPISYLMVPSQETRGLRLRFTGSERTRHGHPCGHCCQGTKDAGWFMDHEGWHQLSCGPAADLVFRDGWRCQRELSKRVEEVAKNRNQGNKGRLASSLVL